MKKPLGMNEASERLLAALENERRYIARELHDDLAQTTLQLGLQAGICRKLLERSQLDMLADELAQLEERTQLASTQMRELIADLRPPKIKPDADVQTYIEHVVDTHLERGGPPVEYLFRWSDPSPPFSAQQMLALARVVQEALLNVRKHAQAKKVLLRLTEDDQNFYLTISDDGKGFDPSEIEARPIDKGGAGLANLRGRVEAITGKLAIASDATGKGTTITVTLPKKEI